MLFDGDHALTESYDPRIIEYYYLKDLFVFVARDNSSDYPNLISLKGDIQKQGFAIESYYRAPDFDSYKFLCEKNSDKQVSHLIENCYGNLILRALTEEEKARVQQYRKKQKCKSSLLKSNWQIESKCSLAR